MFFLNRLLIKTNKQIDPQLEGFLQSINQGCRNSATQRASSMQEKAKAETRKEQAFKLCDCINEEFRKNLDSKDIEKITQMVIKQDIKGMN